MDFHCPISWAEMFDFQKRKAVEMMLKYPTMKAKVRFLLWYNDLHVVRRKENGKWILCCRDKWWFKTHVFILSDLQIRNVIEKMDWMAWDKYNDNMKFVQGYCSVDKYLHGVKFGDYLNMEKYYQMVIATKQKDYERYLGEMMYPGTEGKKFSEVELANVMLWYTHIKTRFAVIFPHFYRRVEEAQQEETDALKIIDQMNMQIRALTKGDVAKEPEIMNVDCWRALTELDTLAMIAKEMEKKK